MNSLLLAFLVSYSLMTPANPASTQKLFPPCSHNQVYKAIYYYQYPGGPECGLTYQYCYTSPPRYHEGCTTSYYDEWYAQCYCE